MDNSSFHTYPSVFNLGHRYIADLLLDNVLIEEKVDGSQFSFGYFPGNPDYPGGWRMRSKGADVYPEAPPAMFKAAVDHIMHLPVTPGWTYRGEVLAKSKHNVLAYDRVPAGNIIIFDINPAQEAYLSYEDKLAECQRLGLEIVPKLYDGPVADVEVLRKFLETTSILGGQKIEGFVIKNYKRFGIDKKVLMGKFVSEAFKEVHHGEWKRENPSSGDIIDTITKQYKTPARFQKALIHLREKNLITDSPKDIGLLIQEVIRDIHADSKEEIKDILFAWAWKRLSHTLTGGVASWYKDLLMQGQFEPKPEA